MLEWSTFQMEPQDIETSEQIKVRLLEDVKSTLDLAFPDGTPPADVFIELALLTNNLGDAGTVAVTHISNARDGYYSATVTGDKTSDPEELKHLYKGSYFQLYNHWFNHLDEFIQEPEEDN